MPIPVHQQSTGPNGGTWTGEATPLHHTKFIVTTPFNC
jgi:hypothetical protein